jgi:Protein of unknown function (DUF1538).
MILISEFSAAFFSTCRDVFPILALLLGFQLFVLRQPVPHPKRLIAGGVYVVIGLALFLMGLEKALFPLGRMMATQLSDPAFLWGGASAASNWIAYGWIYLFAALISFSTTIAEPSLLAVAIKAKEVSGGGVSQWGLRITVALGVAVSISLGAFRIVTGTPLYLYILVGYVIVIVQTIFSPKNIIALAYEALLSRIRAKWWVSCRCRRWCWTTTYSSRLARRFAT